MPLYHYRALNLQGQPQRGDWFAHSKQDLYHHLKGQHLQLLSCRLVKKTGLYSFFLKRISQEALIEFCIHMQEMDKAKISLSESLVLFAENYPHKGLKSVLTAVCHTVQQGLLLSQACQLYPWVFNHHFVDCLAIAEKSGNFSFAFGHLETYLVKQKNDRHQLKQALRYPLILMAGLIALLSILGGVFLPHLQTHFYHLSQHSNNTPPSLAAVTLINTVNFLKDYGYDSLLYGVSGLSVVYCLCTFSKRGRDWWEKFFLKIPLMGTLKKKLFINQFFQTLGLLLNADVTLLNSLEKATASIPNRFLRAEFCKIYKDVQTGSNLSQALHIRGLIPPLFCRYIQLGEQTGALGPLIQQAAEADLKNIWRRLNNLLAWLHPVLIVTIGGIFIWIVMATIVPLYDSLSFLES